MKEQELVMRVHDENILEIDEKSKKKILKELLEISSAASFLHSQIEEGDVKKGLCDTINSTIEFHLRDLGKLTDYASTLTKEMEKRSEKIRAVNMANRELRKQLGDKVSGEDVREFLKNTSERINKFWDIEGLGYVKSINFYQYGARIVFSGVYSGIGFEDEEEKLNELKKKFSFTSDDRHNLLMTEDNIDQIKILLASVFGFCFNIEKIETVNCRGEMGIDLITVRVDDFNVFKNLNYPTYGEV